jgi:hypothetical protein
MNKDELWTMFRSDKKVAFEHFGVEYDQPKLWNEAQAAVSKQIDNLAKTIQVSRTAFQYANNATSDETSDFPKLPSRKRKSSKDIAVLNTT